MAPVAAIGRTFLAFLAGFGRLVLFAAGAFIQGSRPPYYFRMFIRQVVEIGYYSLPVVGMTALFTGMVLALQGYTGFPHFSAEMAIANLVAWSVSRELGPVLTGLMVAGRIGAAMAAELGTMRVTEQIDALSTLATNPYKYLVVPRLLAGAITLPFLVLSADAIGIMGGWIVAHFKLGFNSVQYLRTTFESLHALDVGTGLVKAACFGFLISLMGCYYGFYSQRGARGVGSATTAAVVSSSILILLFDYLLTEAFFLG